MLRRDRKKWFFIFLYAFAFAVLLPQLAEAGGVFKVVNGIVTTSEGATPADQNLSFEAYILGREGDILRQNSTGCGYSAGSWWITVSNFFTGTWVIGEVLRVKFTDAGSGESNTLEVVLNESTTQNTGDFSLPVILSFFVATRTFTGVHLCWRTESEVGNIGFAIYRSEAKDGKYKKIAFVDGVGNSAMSSDYQYLDQKVEKGKTYFYYLQDIDVVGNKSKSQTVKEVNAKNLAVIWAKIKTVR